MPHFSGRSVGRCVESVRLKPASNDYPSVSVDPERPYDGIRELYLFREPELIAAMLNSDRRTARKIINHILVHIYSVGELRLELLKGLLLELVVMMARATVEAGVEQAEVLGMHFRHLTELAELNDDEQLAGWLRDTFERIFAALERQDRTDSPPRIARALAYMRDNLERELAREEVAQHAGISAGHFSHLLRARTGRSFTELLRSFRIEAACGMLRTTDRTLAEIAAACGFCDQAYFTHVFREYKKTTPRQYRETVLARSEATCR
jgi:AraC-like DNA-binding protein